MSEIAIACDLSVFTPEERDHHFAVSQEVFASVQTVRELTDGYAFGLPEDSATLFKVADFISGERQCCPFWTFGVEIAPGGPLWLSLTGPGGAKQAVVSELLDVLNPDVALAAGLLTSAADTGSPASS